MHELERGCARAVKGTKIEAAVEVASEEWPAIRLRNEDGQTEHGTGVSVEAHRCVMLSRDRAVMVRVGVGCVSRRRQWMRNRGRDRACGWSWWRRRSRRSRRRRSEGR